MAHGHPHPLAVVHQPAQAAALLHETRRQLLAHLGEPGSAASLARTLNLPRQRLTYHLRALERDGLVEFVETRRKGNCVERLVRAKAQAFVLSPEALGVLGTTPETAQDRYSAAYLMTMASQTIRDVATLDGRAREAGKRIATCTLDAEIRFANAEARAAFAADLTKAVASLAAKYHQPQAPGGRRFRLVALVHPTLTPPARAAAATTATGTTAVPASARVPGLAEPTRKTEMRTVSRKGRRS